MSNKLDEVMATFDVNITKQQLYDTLMSLSQRDRNDIVCEAMGNDLVLRKEIVETLESWKQ